MLTILLANLPTIVVGAVVLAVLLLIARKLIRDKRNHVSSCGCGCKGCPSAGLCHPKS